MVVVVVDAHANPTGGTDFDQLWYAAKAIRAHVDPYVAIGPHGTPIRWEFPLYYPLTAAVLVLPLTLLPIVAARAIFAAIPSALLAFALSRDSVWRLTILLSAPFLWASGAGQWSVWFCAALFFPAIAGLYLVKPNVGVAYAAGQQKHGPWPASAGAVALLALSFAVAGWWVPEWIATVRSAQHFQPYIAHIGGPLLLLAALRWRRPEARLLLGMAIVPQTALIYEALPILLVAETRLECIGLALSSGATYLLMPPPGAGHADYAGYLWRSGTVILWFVYMPALLILLRRENVGDLPPWLERQTTRLPTWLRGLPQPADGNH